MADWKKSPKSMNLDQLKSYKKELESGGHTGKEYGKVINLIKTLEPNKYDTKTVANAYKSLSSGVIKAGGWTEQNAENIYKYTGKYPTFTLDAQGNPISGASGGTSGASGGDLSSYLNSYQDSVYGAAGSVELRDMIAAQLEPEGLEAPKPLNRIETFEDMRESMGVADLETTMNDLKAQLEEQYATKRARTTDAQGKPVAMGVIAGRVGEIERQENERIDALGRQLNVINDQLNTAYNTIEQYMNFMNMDYQDAVQAYDTAYNRNLQIYKLVDEEMDEQEATAKANLQTYMNAITSGNLSYDSLSSSQKSLINKLELQAKLPIGFIGSLKMSPKDSLLSMSADDTQALMMDANGNFKVVATGLKSSKTGTDTDSKEEAAFDSMVQTGIQQLKDGESWGTVWNRIKSRFPSVPDIVIDSALGTDWRTGGAYEEYLSKKG